MPTPALVAALIASYLLGAIPFAILVGRALRGVDVRHSGSGNVGALNTFRSAGPLPGIIVALLDALKAVLAVLLGRIVAGPQAAALCGSFAIIGHCFSPFVLLANRGSRGGGWKLWLRRAGGKGLASGMAVLLLIDWRLAVAAAVIFGLGRIFVFADETWPTIIGVLGTIPFVWLLTRNPTITGALVIVGVVVIIKHLPDIRQGFYVETLDHSRSPSSD
jgi:acyl phosphate:glycerol-3-phosphate acyltransferase